MMHKISGLTCLLASLTSLHAGIVLEVDVSDPSAVVFTAAAVNAGADSSLNLSTQGITIDDFFTTAVNYGVNTTVSGDLNPSLVAVGDGPYSYFGTFVWEDNDGLFKAGQDLSVYADGDDGPGSQVFQTSSQAFMGSGTFNFSTNVAALPGVGATGNVYSGYLMTGGSPTEGALIGTWQVVPEPGMTTAILGLSVALLVCVRRFKRGPR